MIPDEAIEAIGAMLRAADEYPPEVMDADGSWRLGGAAKRAWQDALTALRNIEAKA